MGGRPIDPPGGDSGRAPHPQEEPLQPAGLILQSLSTRLSGPTLQGQLHVPARRPYVPPPPAAPERVGPCPHPKVRPALPVAEVVDRLVAGRSERAARHLACPPGDRDRRAGSGQPPPWPQRGTRLDRQRIAGQVFWPQPDGPVQGPPPRRQGLGPGAVDQFEVHVTEPGRPGIGQRPDGRLGRWTRSSEARTEGSKDWTPSEIRVIPPAGASRATVRRRCPGSPRR